MLPDAVAGLADADAIVRAAFARGIAPEPQRSVAEWADAERILSDAEGAYPGRWRTERTPYLREVMDCLTLAHPARRVTFMASAQVGKTQCGLNLLGQVATETPAKVLVVLPSLDEALAYNREKLDPAIQASPKLRGAVKDITSRDETGSTSRVKRFPGGSIELVGANSSKGLQMRTVRVVLLEEISEFPADVDGRGDPVDLALARTIAWRGREKVFACSTPGIKGSCRVTNLFEAGSGARFHLPCPHCGEAQALEFENLRWDKGRPETAAMHCSACGVAIAHREKTEMLRRGRWVHARPELVNVHPSFAISALYSPFVTWAEVARESERAADDPVAQKAFAQQWLGIAYEQRFDLPSHTVLWGRREPLPGGRVPPWCLFLTAATDVQGDRLEWAVYGWDRHMGATWLDGGILMGDPLLDPVWAEHDALLARRWRDAWGRDWAPEAWGVDSGYLPQRVYAYARRHAGRSEPRVLALDGRPKWGLPPMGQPRPVDVDYHGRKIGSVLLWPVGTWDIKAEVSAALRLTEAGPGPEGIWPKGAMRFPDRCDLGFFEQITAEACQERALRAGYSVREWVKVRPRNEQFDLAVYARAIARHETASFTDESWARLAARRQGAPDQAQADLMPLLQPTIAAEVARAQPPPPAPPPPEVAARTPRGGWFERRESWF